MCIHINSQWEIVVAAAVEVQGLRHKYMYKNEFG